MRGLIVGGLMALTLPASAADFGINFETANSRLTKNLKPPLELQECKAEICYYWPKEHQIEVAIGLGSNKVVERFSIQFQADNWAIAAAYVRAIQRELFVPERDIASVDNLARNAVSGIFNDERTAAVRCESKLLGGEPTVICSRN